MAGEELHSVRFGDGIQRKVRRHVLLSTCARGAQMSAVEPEFRRDGRRSRDGRGDATLQRRPMPARSRILQNLLRRL